MRCSAASVRDSTPVSSLRSGSPRSRTAGSSSIHLTYAGGRNAWVTACSRIHPSSSSGSPRNSSGTMCSSPPVVSGNSSSWIEASNPMLDQAEPTSPGAVPIRASQVAKRLRTLRCSTATPLGRPVDPEVKIT